MRVLDGKPTFAHFPGEGPEGLTCGACAHVRTYQRTVKNRRGEVVPMGSSVHWCQLAADFAGCRPGRDGRKPSGVGQLPLATPPASTTRGDAMRAMILAALLAASLLAWAAARLDAELSRADTLIQQAELELGPDYFPPHP
ncbi:MAG: hypothetical protein M0006_03440 [Magnetospirillum sp.]|nr:hypothetical protein [Magnetospirillum sp.]